MSYGLTFNGTHSATYNLVMQSKDRNLRPGKSKRKLTVPGRHGSWDFGGGTNQDRTIKIDFEVISNTLEDLRLAARDIAVWLNGKGKLIFDDEPEKYYIAEVFDDISIDQIVTDGRFSVEFECSPFAYFLVSTGEDVILDSDVLLDTDLLIGGPAAYTKHITMPDSFLVNNFGNMALGLDAPSDTDAKFDIIVTGSFGTFSVALNGKTLNCSFTLISSSVTIDCINGTIKEGSTNKLASCSGDIGEFLTLAPGNNTFTFDGAGLDCDVLIDFRPMWI